MERLLNIRDKLVRTNLGLLLLTSSLVHGGRTARPGWQCRRGTVQLFLVDDGDARRCTELLNKAAAGPGGKSNSGHGGKLHTGRAIADCRAMSVNDYSSYGQYEKNT
jgi:hypothetical protein